ncbi:MAG: paraquat-inducible protein B [Candidatus Azotimanducaceae bacterium]|jgi:paraquat-inducible protein B
MSEGQENNAQLKGLSNDPPSNPPKMVPTSSISAIWLVPIVAVLMGSWMSY